MSEHQGPSLKQNLFTKTVVRWLLVVGASAILSSSEFTTAVSQDLVAPTYVGTLQKENVQEPTTLELSKPFDRELSGGQKHIYQIGLTEGQFISIELKLQRIDVIMSLEPPDTKPIIVFEETGRECAILLFMVCGLAQAQSTSPASQNMLGQRQGFFQSFPPVSIAPVRSVSTVQDNGTLTT